MSSRRFVGKRRVSVRLPQDVSVWQCQRADSTTCPVKIFGACLCASAVRDRRETLSESWGNYAGFKIACWLSWRRKWVPGSLSRGVGWALWCPSVTVAIHYSAALWHATYYQQKDVGAIQIAKKR